MHSDELHCYTIAIKWGHKINIARAVVEIIKLKESLNEMRDLSTIYLHIHGTDI